MDKITLLQHILTMLDKERVFGERERFVALMKYINIINENIDQKQVDKIKIDSNKYFCEMNNRAKFIFKGEGVYADAKEAPIF